MQQRDKINKSIKKKKKDDEYSSDEEFGNELLGAPYMPQFAGNKRVMTPREENPVIFVEISTLGGTKLLDGNITPPRCLGRLYFELRTDLVPVACSNFMALITGARGRGPHDGINYHYKGTRIHNVTKDLYFQGGDLIDERGNCSRSIFNQGGLFRDENFILRNTGPGCISYCNRGPDTNGSLFQVIFRQNHDLDESCVVFGCLAADESYEVLGIINNFGTTSGRPLEELRISDCGISYPDPNPQPQAASSKAKSQGKR